MARRRSQAIRLRSEGEVLPTSEAAWATGPRASDVEFALRDAQNMVRLLAANVEFLAQPREETAVETVAGDIREGTRRLGQLLGIIAGLLSEDEESE
jgi:hypothetical protein